MLQKSWRQQPPLNGLKNLILLFWGFIWQALAFFGLFKGSRQIRPRGQKGFVIIEGLIAAGLLTIMVYGGISVYEMLIRARTTSIQTEQIKSFLNWRASYLEGAEGCVTFLDQIGVSKVPLGNPKSLNEVKVKVDANPYTLFKVGQPELNGNLVVNEIQLSDPKPPHENLKWSVGMKQAYLSLSIKYTGFKREGVKTNFMMLMINPSTGAIIGCTDIVYQVGQELKAEACDRMGFYWDDTDVSVPPCRWEDPLGLNLNTEFREQICNSMNYKLDVDNDAKKCSP
jgi:hypothetical protein